MPAIELIYDGDCPHVAEARARLLRAAVRAGIRPRWREWRGDAADSPEHARGRGSPTILIEGEDVAPEAGSEAARCRLYVQPDGAVAGAPSEEALAAALARAGGSRAGEPRAGDWKLGAAVVPGVAAALLPKVACPACWPAYAGVLSAVGLGFLLDASYLLPLTAAFLALAVGALGFRAPRRRGYGPFFAGLAATGVVLAGKFFFESDPAMYVGLALLVSASIWNGWPKTRIRRTCRGCKANY